MIALGVIDLPLWFVLLILAVYAAPTLLAGLVLGAVWDPPPVDGKRRAVAAAVGGLGCWIVGGGVAFALSWGRELESFLVASIGVAAAILVAAWLRLRARG